MIDIQNPLIVFLNTSGVFVLILLVLAYLWFIEKSYEETLHIILALVFTATVSIFLKELFHLPRPFEVAQIGPKAGFATLASFPSLHTALAFALATTVLFHQRR